MFDIVFPGFVLWLCLFFGINGDKTYVAHFTDDVFGCDGFGNDYMDCKLTLCETKTPDGFDACGLSGQLNMMKSIDTDHDVYVEIWKVLPCDKEMMWRVSANLCDSLKNTDAPWYCLVEAMNITGCPIEIGTYNIKDLLISLDFAKDILTHEFVGFYTAVLKITQNNDPVICYTCELSIEEED